MIVMNLVTPRAAAKREHLLNKLASGFANCSYCYIANFNRPTAIVWLVEHWTNEPVEGSNPTTNERVNKIVERQMKVRHSYFGYFPKPNLTIEIDQWPVL
jgi:hypothetical protein